MRQRRICSVPDCNKSADFEVFLYDKYSNGSEFLEQDNTCPFLCKAHAEKNENSARGRREPRRVVNYPFSNRHGAQGYTKYKQITGTEDDHPAINTLLLLRRTDELSQRRPELLQSTFISHGGPDEPFAIQLNDALRASGVTTFLFAKDAIPGQRLHRLMREKVNEHDRVILICSSASLNRSGVLNEITETLQREARDGGREYLIPITLDDFVFLEWHPSDMGLAQAIRDRVVADFRGADKDATKFTSGVERLLNALKG